MTQVTFITLYWILVTIFSGFTLFMVGRYRMLPSYSESYYVILEKQKNKNTFSPFQVFLWVLGFLTAFVGSSLLWVLAGAGLVFTGTAAQFKENSARTVHIVGATGSIFLSLSAMIFEMHVYWLAILAGGGMLGVLLCSTYKKSIPAHTAKIEFIGFLSAIVALGIKVYSL